MVIAAGLATGFFGVRAPLAFADRSEVPIGVIAPLTGPQATYGEDLQRISQILLPQLTERSSKYRYTLYLEDGKCGTGSDALTAAQKLISLNAVKFLIVACSGEVLQIAPLISRERVLLIGTAATHPDISNLGEYIFRTAPDISQGVHAIVPRMRASGRSKFAVITEESAFTLGISKVLEAELGHEIVSDQTFPLNEPDLRPIVSKALSSGAQALYLNIAAPSTFQNIVKLLRGHKATIPLFGYHQPAELQNRTALGSMMEGIEFFDVAPTAHPPEGYTDTMNSYRAQFNNGATTEWLARTAYDAITATVEVIERVGPSPDKGREALLSLDHKGALDRLTFSKSGNIDSPAFAVFVIDKGAQVVVAPDEGRQ